MSGFSGIHSQFSAEGAEPQLYAATAPGVQGGDYFGPTWRIRGHPVSAEMAPQARDEEAARRLWGVSAGVTGVDIDGVMGGAVASPVASR